MTLVTAARYQWITGDTITPSALVEERIEEAVSLLEEELGRPLEQAERTEIVWADRAGRLYPLATPIIDAPGWTIDGHTLTGRSMWGAWFDEDGSPETTTVTYTGGWVERSGNPTAPNRLPVCIERDLAWCAFRLGQPTNTALVTLPAGVDQVRLGDAALSTTSPTGLNGAAASVAAWSAETLRYRRRTVLGVR